jgi:hypothetical protein
MLRGQGFCRAGKALQVRHPKLLVTVGACSSASRSRTCSSNPAGLGPARQALKRLHTRQGAERPARQPVGCSGSRVRLPQQASPRFGQIDRQFLVLKLPAARSGERSSRSWYFTNRGFTPGEA